MGRISAHIVARSAARQRNSPPHPRCDNSSRENSIHGPLRSPTGGDFAGAKTPPKFSPGQYFPGRRSTSNANARDSKSESDSPWREFSSAGRPSRFRASEVLRPSEAERDMSDADMKIRRERLERCCRSHGLPVDDASTETLAARVVQHAFRLRNYVYRQFGPSLFSMSGGKHTAHGSLTFPNSLSSVKRPSPFIAVSSTTSVTLMMQFLEKYWRLHSPEVIISVTGGAQVHTSRANATRPPAPFCLLVPGHLCSHIAVQDFELSPRLQNMFDRGLVSAATAAKAWVITGGTNTGVMKLVGNAMHTHQADAPVIGIGPWGACNRRESMASCAGGNVQYRMSKPSRDGAPLNPFQCARTAIGLSSLGPRAQGGGGGGGVPPHPPARP